jgi:hypothetical protein
LASVFKTYVQTSQAISFPARNPRLIRSEEIELLAMMGIAELTLFNLRKNETFSNRSNRFLRLPFYQ